MSGGFFSVDINPSSYHEIHNQKIRKIMVGEIAVIFALCLFQFARFPVPFKAPKNEQAKRDIEEEEYSEKNILMTREVFFHTVNHCLSMGLALWQPGLVAIMLMFFHMVFFLILYIGFRRESETMSYMGRFGVGLWNICLIITGLTTI